MFEVDEERLRIARDALTKELSLFTTITDYGGSATEGVQFCKCLFHPEGNPSMQLVPEESRFVCYSCGRHGSTIKLVQFCEEILKQNKMNYVEVVNFLLKSNASIAQRIGFADVFIHDIAIKTLKRDEAGKVIWQFGNAYTPRYAPIQTCERIARQLKQTKFTLATEDYIQQVMLFVSACEMGFTADTVSRCLQQGKLFHTSEDLALEIGDDVLEDFSTLF